MFYPTNISAACPGCVGQRLAYVCKSAIKNIGSVMQLYQVLSASEMKQSPSVWAALAQRASLCSRHTRAPMRAWHPTLNGRWLVNCPLAPTKPIASVQEILSTHLIFPCYFAATTFWQSDCCTVVVAFVAAQKHSLAMVPPLLCPPSSLTRPIAVGGASTSPEALNCTPKTNCVLLLFSTERREIINTGGERRACEM